MGWENIHQKLFRGAFLKLDEQILFVNRLLLAKASKTFK